MAAIVGLTAVVFVTALKLGLNIAEPAISGIRLGTPMAIFIIHAAWLLVVPRLGLVLPACAVGHAIDFKSALMISRGHAWRFTAATALTSAAFLKLYLAEFDLELSPQTMTAEDVFVVAILGCCHLMFVVVNAGLLALTYQHCTGKK